MIYEVIVGSRASRLDIDGSDVDVGMVFGTESPSKQYKDSECHMIPLSIDEFMDYRYIRTRTPPYQLNWFFPHDFCIESDLSRWIGENREDIIRAQLPTVYSMYATASATFANSLAKHYLNGADWRKKRVAYAIHYRNILYHYANGMTFAEAHKAQGETRDFLLAVRKGEVPVKLVLEENAKARERAKSVAGYYQEPRADLSVLDEFKYMVQREVKLLERG